MGVTRRDFLTLGIGAAAAVPFTPIPWKLLDDTAKWSQNWSWIPRPPRGERSVRYTSCTLCPSGCGMRVRCVGKNLVGIAPLAGHPVSKGVLCPYAFGAHQLPYHGARITRPMHHGNPLSLDQAASEITRRVKAGTFAILDERPGRAVSAAYRKIGTYVVADRPESTTLQLIASGAGLAAEDLGLDLENVRTLVSFGAPVLESWGTPGRVLTLWKEKKLAIIQVEPHLSKTAALASKWLPSVKQPMTFHMDGPLLAISGGGLSEADEQAVAALNEGSNAIIRRAGAPAIPATRLNTIPDGSIDVLFIDHGPLGGSLSIDALRPKLRSDGIIVSLSPYSAGVAALADYLIPTPAFAESLDEAPTPWDAAVPSYATAPVLLDPPAGAVHPLDFINRVTGGDAAPGKVIRSKVDSLYTAKRGEVFTFTDQVKKPVMDFKSSDDLWKAFTTGACWIDESARPVPVHYRASAGKPTAILARRPAISPPLFTKIQQESRIGRS